MTEEQKEFKKILCNTFLRVRFSIIEKIKRKEKASNFSVFSGRFDTSDGSPKVLIIGPAEINDFLPVSTWYYNGYIRQTWAYWSTILLGTIYWPFFNKKCNSSIGIGIGAFEIAIFALVLLLLVIKILNIGLYLGNIWYCFDIVQWHTLIPINE